MSIPRSASRRLLPALVAMAMAAALLASPLAAAPAAVTGTLSFAERIALGPGAMAVVTLVDQSADADAGAIVGQQRIDAPGAVPIPFSVLYEADAIADDHAYALFATVIDASGSWQSTTAVPVITGGPTNGVEVELSGVPTGLPAVTGTIEPPADTALSGGAIAIAVLIKAETGTLVSRDVRPVADGGALAFAIPVVPELLDPAATYVVKGALVDGTAVWEDRSGQSAISAGQVGPPVTLRVTRTPADLPGEPTPPPTIPTEPPTETPTEAPTDGPTQAPTDAPTQAPTEAPTDAPTEAPTDAPTATPAPSPTASPSPSPSPDPSPTPIAGPLTGTLDYAEPQELSSTAFAVVALVSGRATAASDTIVATEIIRDPGQAPIDFELEFATEDIDPTTPYTVQAMIVDGANAWATARGTEVLTRGAPTDVDLVLTYRPDLVKGAVSGQVTAVGLEPAADAYVVAVLLEPSSGSTLGIDVRLAEDGLPVPFEIPFDIRAVDRTQDYLIHAEVGDESTTTWTNTVGVPVITKEHPLTGVQVVVAEIVRPTPAPTASPGPSAPPEEPAETSVIGPTLGLALLAGAVVGGVAYVNRRRTT